VKTVNEAAFSLFSLLHSFTYSLFTYSLFTSSLFPVSTAFMPPPAGLRFLFGTLDKEPACPHGASIGVQTTFRRIFLPGFQRDRCPQTVESTQTIFVLLQHWR
jgi:hypothetical protein